MSARARVCVLHVGGTIGMVRTATGFEPQPGFLQRYIAAMPEMDRPELPAHDVVILEPLLDSADMAPEDWLRIAAATEREVVVVNCSQCHGGSVRQTLYSTGAALARCGVISGGDMTPEAALTKLYCLLAAGLSPGQVRVRMQEDLAGELIPG